MQITKKNVLRYLNIKPINKPTVLIIGVILTLVAGCKKGINNPTPPKDYLEYRNVIQEGLIAYYPFDGNAKDYSGNENYDGTKYGPSASVGRFGQQQGALKFDGIDDYVEIPNFSNINGESGTICFWVRTPGTVEENRRSAVISKIDTVGIGYVLSLYGLHDFVFNYKLLHFMAEEAMFTNFWEDGKYLFLAVTFSNNRLTYFFQGYPTFESTFKPAGVLKINDNNQPLFIGKSLISQYEFFKGDIDDLLIFNRALSKDEILKLYNWK